MVVSPYSRHKKELVLKSPIKEKVKLTKEQVKVAKMVARLILTIIEWEKKISKARSQLSQIGDFDSLQKYQELSRGYGVVTVESVVKFLEANNLSRNSRELLSRD